MSQEEDYNKEKNQIANGLFVILVICVISVALIGWLIASKLSYELPPDINQWGVIGDFVGGLSNPLISTFTFFALLLTIIQNQKVIGINEAELRETRKEIELTREANEKQAEEFKAQNNITINQAEIQTTTSAVLKIAELINKVWKGPTTQTVQTISGNGKVINEVAHLNDCFNPLSGIINSKEFLESVEETISELVLLLELHKKLLNQLKLISPNNSMVIAFSLLMKEPVQCLETNGAFERVLGESDGAEVVQFYNEHWLIRETE